MEGKMGEIIVMQLGKELRTPMAVGDREK